MRLFKALFGGIAAFFGILFGGLIDNIVGAFKSEDVEPIPQVATISPPVSPQAPVSQQAPVTTMPAPTPIKPADPVIPTIPFIANEIPAPRPRRRPGKAMTPFMELAKSIPSASRSA